MIAPAPIDLAACPLALITWHDSQTTYVEWTLIDEIEDDRPRLHVIQTVGWVLRENDHAVLIAQCIGGLHEGGTPQVCHVMTIPKCCIVERKALL